MGCQLFLLRALADFKTQEKMGVAFQATPIDIGVARLLSSPESIDFLITG